MAESARQRQKLQTRENIMQAARQLMADGRGLDSLGLREVARQAALAPPSLYNHFPDMEALGLALIDVACFNLRSAMAKERRSMLEVGAEQAIADLVDRFQQYIWSHEVDFRLVVQQRLGPNPRFRRRIQNELKLLINELQEDIQSAVAAQGRAPVPAREEAEGAIAIMFGVGITMLGLARDKQVHMGQEAKTQLKMLVLGGRCIAEGESLAVPVRARHG